MDTRKLDSWADLLLDTGKRNQLIHFRDTRFSTVEILLPSAEELFDRIDGAASFEIFHPGLEEDEDLAEEQSGRGQQKAESGPERQEIRKMSAEQGNQAGQEAPAGQENQTDQEAPAEQKNQSGQELLEKHETQAEQDVPAEQKVYAEEAASQAKETETDETDGRAAWLAKYSSRIRKKNQLLVYNRLANPMAAVRNIGKKAREFTEETGVNVAYAAFGFIHWTEKESSGQVYRAPVLLAPVRLEQESAIAPYYLRTSEDEIIVNPTFSYKIEGEYGIRLPEYEDEGLEGYLEKVRKMVGKLHWQVTCESRLGIFSFLKINMYRDLKENGEQILKHANIRRLLGEASEEDGREFLSGGAEAAEASGDADPLISLHSVVDADSSQMDAIEMAKSGRSFVLQGPPGTGKSQTITNIIAECLSDGKKVLFVSEKQAALNVVYDKLKAAGLSEFCLELHSYKAGKQAVIADICHTLRLGRRGVSARAEEEIAIKEKARRQLDAYAAELHQLRPVIEKSLYQLYSLHASLRHVPDVEWAVPELKTRGEGFLAEVCSLLEQYADYVPIVGYQYRNNPWYGYTGQDTSYQTRLRLKEDLTAAVGLLQPLIQTRGEMRDRWEISCGSLEEAGRWQRFFQTAANSELITPAFLQKDRFETADAALRILAEKSGEIREIQSELDTVYDSEIYQISGGECHKKLTRMFGSFFSRLFNREYQQLVGELRMCKKDGKGISYRQAVSLTEKISRFQQLTEEYQEAEEPVKSWLGPGYAGMDTDWKDVLGQMDVLREMFEKGMTFGKLAEDHYEGLTEECSEGLEENRSEDLADERQTELESFAVRLEGCGLSGNEALSRLAGLFREDVIQIPAASLEGMLEKFAGCLEEMDRLDNWCHFRSLLSDLERHQSLSFLDQAISRNLEAEDISKAFRKLFYAQWIDTVLSASPVLSAFSRGVQDRAVDLFARKDREQFAINRARIRAELSADRPSMDIIASGSPLSVLLREGEKKRRQKSIRTLLAETGELVQRVKPCFLMSPLSVSTFLTPDAVHFDVVIFDEASQIFPQDAIGAIYRGDQLIVVGDSRQMPPSNFFSASIENEDVDEEKDDLSAFESVLDLCAAVMPQLRLRWHYRSRCEGLIAFSNQNFYDNELITFPSAREEGSGNGVEYFYADGVFDRKSHTNRKEAELAVELIYRHIAEHPERSLGVVAFSAAQQDLIDRLLARRRQSAPEWEFFFREDGKEPFFIKNLETVQGDERDTIIFSIAYGKDAQGRLLHNFGPLNRAGGERRLNVAVTRAKYQIQVISSMHAADIDLKRTSAEGARLLRAYLDYAENGHQALVRTLTVSPFEQFDSDFEMEVCEFLRKKGYAVDTQVGCSGFRIDMGLKRPDSSDYVLAIECDGASYHSSKNARDRDRLRQEILEGMGWKFYRIWSTDWFRNRAVEQNRLLAAAEAAVRNPRQEQEEGSGQREKEDAFEEVLPDTHFAFPRYRAADLEALEKRYLPHDFQGLVRAVLETEAPLSESLLLKRIVGFFGREKVTSAVQRAYEEAIDGCGSQGILRKDGFLYLKGKRIRFRTPGDLEREIRQIAPEELAAGMLDILRQNIAADRSGLYHSLALQCGVTRVGKAAGECFDKALACLKDRVEIDGEMISLREETI